MTPPAGYLRKMKTKTNSGKMMKTKRKKMPYSTRIERYEAEKKRIASECTNYYEYEQRIKALAQKYGL